MSEVRATRERLPGTAVENNAGDRQVTYTDVGK